LQFGLKMFVVIYSFRWRKDIALIIHIVTSSEVKRSRANQRSENLPSSSSAATQQLNNNNQQLREEIQFVVLLDQTAIFMQFPQMLA